MVAHPLELVGVAAGQRPAQPGRRVGGQVVGSQAAGEAGRSEEHDVELTVSSHGVIVAVAEPPRHPDRPTPHATNRDLSSGRSGGPGHRIRCGSARGRRRDGRRDAAAAAHPAAQARQRRPHHCRVVRRPARLLRPARHRPGRAVGLGHGRRRRLLRRGLRPVRREGRGRVTQDDPRHERRDRHQRAGGRSRRARRREDRRRARLPDRRRRAHDVRRVGRRGHRARRPRPRRHRRCRDPARRRPGRRDRRQPAAPGGRHPDGRRRRERPGRAGGDGRLGVRRDAGHGAAERRRAAPGAQQRAAGARLRDARRRPGRAERAARERGARAREHPRRLAAARRRGDRRRHRRPVRR